ncbi:cell wall metabolism sensor histidine kinase WalK [Pedobacter sp. HMWF019]|uniref:sensor histidine kinase n=1 Tax=Pedobacter sp. HMWF019 TaxID=2056856 RepID=UPI001304F966|nr:PAS domain S-box protein [Pedobacter sp. HMWF019]
MKEKLAHYERENYKLIQRVLELERSEIELRKAARSMEEKSATLSAIIKSSDDAIVSKTLDGIITSWNSSAERIFGYNEQEMIGQPILKIIPEDRQDEEVEILSKLRRGIRVDHFETKRLTKNGILLDVSLTISPVRNTAGAIIGLSKIARDISEKKLEEHRKHNFVAMVSHELKTPLTAITAYIQILLQVSKKDSNPFYLTTLTRAEAQAKKMISMIQDFLSLARLEEGKIQINKEKFELHPLIKDLAEDAQFLTRKHTINLVSCDNIWIYGDPEKLGHVIMNLLNNAIKYSPEGGAITIHCEKQNDYIKISVKDEGVGISPIDQKRLFERFYRVNNDKIKTVSGFGIGLYLASEILRFHDSKIQVESQEGIGSIFSFSLNIHHS